MHIPTMANGQISFMAEENLIKALHGISYSILSNRRNIAKKRKLKKDAAILSSFLCFASDRMNDLYVRLREDIHAFAKKDLGSSVFLLKKVGFYR